MRRLILLLVLAPGAAQAHFGHLGEVAGHGHWVAGAALGAAVAVGVWGWWKGRQEAEDKASEDDPEAEAEEA